MAVRPRKARSGSAMRTAVAPMKNTKPPGGSERCGQSRSAARAPSGTGTAPDRSGAARVVQA
jgi:hypothetical protein